MPGLTFISLGSNQGDSPSILCEALERLRALSRGSLRCSSLWETTPVDCPPGSPQFVNAVAGLAPLEGETPETLLGKLQMLEIEFGGRPKHAHNEPRPLDLDLICFGTEQRATPRLILPHPRAHLRRFVLQPLSEIAPDLVMPNQTKTVECLLRDLISSEAVSLLDSRAASSALKSGEAP